MKEPTRLNEATKIRWLHEVKKHNDRAMPIECPYCRKFILIGFDNGLQPLNCDAKEIVINEVDNDMYHVECLENLKKRAAKLGYVNQ